MHTNHHATIQRQEADDHWYGYINQRLNATHALLTSISHTIETIDPEHRAHAADLLDTSLQALQRLHNRYGPAQPQDDPENPPF